MAYSMNIEIKRVIVLIFKQTRIWYKMFRNNNFTKLSYPSLLYKHSTHRKFQNNHA